MVEVLVIVWLTFMDGSVVQYYDDNGSVPVITAENGDEGIKQCAAKIEEILIEMREDFKDHDPKPSTFIKGCTVK